MIPGQGLGESLPAWNGRSGETGQQLQQLSRGWQLTKAVQARADLGFLQLAQIALRRIEGVVGGGHGKLQLRQLPQGVLAQGVSPGTAQLRRLPVLIQQGLQPRRSPWSPARASGGVR